MSQGYRQDYRQYDGEAPEPLVWERVTWRQGDGRYVFEVEEGGLHAKLSSPHGTSLTLPMVAWEGLLDAVMGARKARTRNERSFPARSGARWYDGEADELAAGFKAGRTIAQLARIHNRSAYGIELQLERLGLWDRINHDIPDLDDRIRAGEFAPLREWLGEKVHCHGSKFLPKDLMERVLGTRELDPQPLATYLEQKVNELYGLQMPDADVPLISQLLERL